MYKQLSEKKGGYKEQLHSIIFSSLTLEFSVNETMRVYIEKMNSSSLNRWRKKYIPIVSKIRVLRFAKIISEELYNDLTILFKIRNRFAHSMKLAFGIKEGDFKELAKIQIDSDFVKNLSNDSVKFQLISSYCFKELLLITQKVNPADVLDLEFTGDKFEILEN